MDKLTLIPFADPSPLRHPIAVGITAEGTACVQPRRRADRHLVGLEVAKGRVVLGILNRSVDQLVGRVSFTDVQIRA